MCLYLQLDCLVGNNRFMLRCPPTAIAARRSFGFIFRFTIQFYNLVISHSVRIARVVALDTLQQTYNNSNNNKNDNCVCYEFASLPATYDPNAYLVFLHSIVFVIVGSTVVAVAVGACSTASYFILHAKFPKKPFKLLANNSWSDGWLADWLTGWLPVLQSNSESTEWWSHHQPAMLAQLSSSASLHNDHAWD